MLAEQSWYYLNRSRQVGPFTRAEIFSLLESKIIEPTTLVWTQGGGGWCEIRTVPSEEAPPRRSRATFHCIVGLMALSIAAGGVALRSGDTLEGEFEGIAAKHAEYLEALGKPVGLPEKTKDPARIMASADADLTSTLTPAAEVETTGASEATSVVYLVPAPPSKIEVGKPTRIALTSQEQRELDQWKSISRSDDAVEFRSYLKAYPNGPYSVMASQKAADLEEASIEPAAKPVVVKAKKIVVKKVAAPSVAKALPVKIEPVKPKTRCWNDGVASCRATSSQR